MLLDRAAVAERLPDAPQRQQRLPGLQQRAGRVAPVLAALWFFGFAGSSLPCSPARARPAADGASASGASGGRSDRSHHGDAAARATTSATPATAARKAGLIFGPGALSAGLCSRASAVADREHPAANNEPDEVTVTDAAGTTEARCDEIGGQWIEFTGYMVHLWNVPGYESRDGLFAENPDAVACQRSADPALDHESPLAELFEEQLGAADLVVINKTDLLTDADWPGVEQRVRAELRPGVRLVRSRHAEVPLEVLLGIDAAAVGAGAKESSDAILAGVSPREAPAPAPSTGSGQARKNFN